MVKPTAVHYIYSCSLHFHCHVNSPVVRHVMKRERKYYEDVLQYCRNNLMVVKPEKLFVTA